MIIYRENPKGSTKQLEHYNEFSKFKGFHTKANSNFYIHLVNT